MKRSQGFTVIEIIIVIAFLGLTSAILFSQRSHLITTHRDDQRKVAVNAMYYALEEVYHAKHGFYPAALDDGTLKSIDPSLLTDPNEVMINDPQSNYRYEPSNCVNERCKQYTLRADLEGEADFVKTNRTEVAQ